MWPFCQLNKLWQDKFSKKNNIISIILEPENMVISWIKKEKKLDLLAHENFTLNKFDYLNGLIFNYENISKKINFFMQKNKIKRPLISLSVSGPGIFEKTIKSANTIISEKEIFSYIQNSTDKIFCELQNIYDEKDFYKKLNLSYAYICPSNDRDSEHNFYLCAISDEKIFQYKLLSKKLNIKIINLSTKLPAMIQLYKYYKKDEFTGIGLYKALESNNFNSIFLLSKPELLNIINIKNGINFEKNYNNIALCAGLFLLGEKHEPY